MSDNRQINADVRYYALLEQLIQSMTDLDQFNLQRIYDILSSLCVILGVFRGVTTFYEDLAHEARGEGEAFVCYDSGEKSRLISEKRNGVGEVLYFNEDIIQEKEKIMRVQQRFTMALAQEECLVYYQPWWTSIPVS